MTVLRIALLFFLAAAGQWWAATYASLWGIAPQILLVLTVIVAARQGPIPAMCLGFAWGLFLDVFRLQLVGANSLALTMVGYGVGNLRRQVDVSSAAPASVVVLGVSWGYSLAVGTIGLLFARHFIWPGWSAFLVDPLVNCLVAPLLFRAWDTVVEA